ncbi:hypothetical protein ACNOYE_25060 [Nannocystaceae bacterium ST9]
MASDSLRYSLGLLALAVGVVGSLVGDTALAAPPTEADFRITYFLTDELGDKSRQLSLQDMTSLVGQARCECDQEIIARIGRNGTNTVDAVQITAMVGQQCAMAQAMPGVTPYSPCVQFVAGLPTVFQNAPEFKFSPIWLAHGVQGSTQTIDAAVPDGTCNSIYGQGGIWMCAGSQSCMLGDFFMQGTANINVGEGGTAQGISFDFVPPLTAPTNFEAQPGDSAINIAWDASSIGDISGYRVLCADAQGNPVSGFDYPTPSETDLVKGQIYFTRDNLCPGGPFGEDYDPEGNGWADDSTDTGTDSTDSGTDSTDSGSTDSTDTSSTDSGSTDTSSTDSTDTGTDTGSCTIGSFGCLCDDGACDDGYECSEAGFCGLPTSGLLSLDWAYLCSPHISNTSQSARVEGLENGVEYQFLVVAYDFAGNPLPSEVFTATPIQTNGLWEQCEAQGNICGEPGFCAVVEPTRGQGWLVAAFALLGLTGMGVGARRRRSA